jgi:hypothetical protein
MANKYLDNTGLAYLWETIKAIIPTKTSELTNDSHLATQEFVINLVSGNQEGE